MRPALVTVLLFSMVAPGTTSSCRWSMLCDDQLYPLTVGLRTWYQSASIGNGGGGRSST